MSWARGRAEILAMLERRELTQVTAVLDDLPRAKAIVDATESAIDHLPVFTA